jgi:hypothetical protein
MKTSCSQEPTIGTFLGPDTSFHTVLLLFSNINRNVLLPRAPEVILQKRSTHFSSSIYLLLFHSFHLLCFHHINKISLQTLMLPANHFPLFSCMLSLLGSNILPQNPVLKRAHLCYCSNPLKPIGSIISACFNALNLRIFPTEWPSLNHIVLTINSDSFPK